MSIATLATEIIFPYLDLPVIGALSSTCKTLNNELKRLPDYIWLINCDSIVDLILGCRIVKLTASPTSINIQSRVVARGKIF